MKPSARQIAFDLPFRTSQGQEDFFVSAPNASAVKMLDQWPDWPQHCLLLIGPEGSGKSHLGALWANRAGAHLADLQQTPAAQQSAHWLVEDADRLSSATQEEALFHLFNAVRSAGGSMVITARTVPARWFLELADLRSRMQAMPIAQLSEPDDALLKAVLVKHFNDRQIETEARLIDYLVPRMERSFAAVRKVVSELDRLSLEQKRPVTYRLAGELFGD